MDTDEGHAERPDEAHAQPTEPMNGEQARVGARVTASADHEQVSGLIRRVRRMAKLSQRQLAHELGVSQSAVAKWETGRTSPTARMLVSILRVVDLAVAAVRAETVHGTGEAVMPMASVAARDAGGRRYPAHTFVWAEGWWAPEGSETTAWFDQFRWRSEVLELPRVRYSRRWQLGRRLTTHDIHEHPTWDELVAEARQSWAPQRRNILSIPEWALQDTKKSRNRRPEEFRALARVVSVARASPVGRAHTLVPAPARE
ncbi:helix-turn-helix transcriptional regulator [Nocardioides sp.]|uniref:helix-turn-helix domain-containing protein n=1 Tax=Nocardioides sp. TaxID=35761 RepID=UPI002C7C6C75|nr:helix-turn-helix transcriptional regulator [Nocardioides sp.]HXH80819.1 helix-turn-helix transcriptional regulator [Nocardioides sp.]